jgi:3-hydroxybutyryl-CoA dehydrogenase
VIPGEATSQETLDATVALLREVGKEPAVTRSVPGFVGNRIQLVMAAEAFRCVEQGIASAEDVDAIVRSSFGFRLGAYGPLRVADLAGLDTYLGVYDYMTERVGDPWYEAPALVRSLVEQGRTGVKAAGGVYDYTEEEARRLRAERDRLLYARLAAYLADRGE